MAHVAAAWTNSEKSVTPRVLVVEDEPHIRELVCLHLGIEGYVCDGVGDGPAALKRTESERFDLLVLDVMIPGIDGLSVCRAVRNGKINHDVPILMLTARRDESDKVIGLESGADDYLTKPFSFRELLARLRALVRRGTRERPAVLEAANLRLDPAARRVWRGEAEIDLTQKEFALLEVMMRHRGEVNDHLRPDSGQDPREGVVVARILDVKRDAGGVQQVEPLVNHPQV